VCAFVCVYVCSCPIPLLQPTHPVIKRVSKLLIYYDYGFKRSIHRRKQPCFESEAQNVVAQLIGVHFAAQGVGDIPELLLELEFVVVRHVAGLSADERGE